MISQKILVLLACILTSYFALVGDNIFLTKHIPESSSLLAANHALTMACTLITNFLTNK